MNNLVFGKKQSLRTDILDEMESKLYELDVIFSENIFVFLKKYKEEITKMLNIIINMQQNKQIKMIGVISIILSRTNILNEDFNYKIKIYGEKMYVDNYDFHFNLDVSDIYKYFISAKNNLYKDVKKFIGIMSPCDIDKEIYDYLKYFNMYIITVLREVFKSEEVIKILNKVDKLDDFYIIQNELYEAPYLIFKYE